MTLATVRQTNVPGLWDVVTSEGEAFSDLTTAQVHVLVRERGWKIEFVDVMR